MLLVVAGYSIESGNVAGCVDDADDFEGSAGDPIDDQIGAYGPEEDGLGG